MIRTHKVYELNLDGLVGPTHHYAGLAPGNTASFRNALAPANPRAAAEQGLQKMRFLHQLGLQQALMPPQQRPNLDLLHQLGFKGSPQEQITKAYQQAPELLSAAYSASSMWAANAATVSPSTDTLDHKVHFTTANLVSNLHRHQEAVFSKRVLQFLFSDQRYFVHHPILPTSLTTADEGAANHNRLAATHASPGLQLFVYGREASHQRSNTLAPQKYPARQTKEACQSLARAHLLNPNKVVFAQQHPAAIDAGVFHNDVISVANESVFLVHESAFYDPQNLYTLLESLSDVPLQIIEFAQEDISLQEAVETYLFNSQLLTLPDAQGMLLLAPSECESNPAAKACIDTLLADHSNPINRVHYMNLKQSMRNGGGPACLRMRIVLNEEELAAMHQRVLVNENLLSTLEHWVARHYRSQLQQEDLADPQLMDEGFRALDELTSILGLGSIYPFQRD